MLTPALERFVLHWGEMGSRWGINRTVAQIHALLYVADRPLNAEEIVETLGVARSNVSTSLKELQGWGVVRTVHVMGDRRDHFQTLHDVWEMFQIILDERKRREIDPTLAFLREILEETPRRGPKAGLSGDQRQRLEDLRDFFETMDRWYGHVRRLPQAATRRFVRMGSKLSNLLSA